MNEERIYKDFIEVATLRAAKINEEQGKEVVERKMKEISHQYEAKIKSEIERIREILPDKISETISLLSEDIKSKLEQPGFKYARFTDSICFPLSLNDKDEKINYYLVCILESAIVSEIKKILPKEVLRFLIISVTFNIERKYAETKELLGEIFDSIFGNSLDDVYTNKIIVKITADLS